MPALVGEALAQALPPRLAEPTRAEGPSPHRDGDRAWGHFTRRQSTAFMFMREHVPALSRLGKGPWALVQAIACHWQAGRSDAYPSQERLARHSGYDVRSIRAFTKVLEAELLLEVARERLPDGSSRLYYEPGPALLAAVAEFDAEYRDERPPPSEARPLGPPKRGTVGMRAPVVRAGVDGRRTADRESRQPQVHPPKQAEVASGGDAAMVPAELPDLEDLKTHSSSSRVGPEKLRCAEQEQGSKISETDWEIAFEVLAMLRERRFGRGARLFEANVLEMVATCVSVVEGDREAKRRAQLDAIEHAFGVSHGAPTPSYIWGSIDHFLEHEARGRTARLHLERAQARRAHAAAGQRQQARVRSLQGEEVCGITPQALRFIDEFGRKR